MTAMTANPFAALLRDVPRNPPPYTDGALMYEADVLAALAAAVPADLADPVTVHANMLRGTIAKPTVAQIIHLYGREAFQPMIDAAVAKALDDACLAVSEHADWPEDEHGRTEQVGLFARVINAIRAIAPAQVNETPKSEHDSADVLTALAAAVPADLAEAGKVLENLRDERTIATRTEAANLITALLARIAAQEAQMKGLEAEGGKPVQATPIDAVQAKIGELTARAEAAETALAAMTKERDAAEAELVGAFEAAAEAVEELSKAPGTTWGQVKGHIRAMGDVGDRRAYQSMRTALAAERAKVAKLVEALTRIAAEDARTNCRHGDPDQPFHVDGPLGKIARAAITEAGQ